MSRSTVSRVLNEHPDVRPAVRALAGALGGALATMVANLCSSKGEFDDKFDTLCDIADRGQADDATDSIRRLIQTQAGG